MPYYFIVRIEIEKQKERKEKIGSLYVHASHTFMQRNLQYGEIVAIGSIAATQFREAKVGNTLLIHHFVEKPENIINSDEKYNYYNVTTSEWNGRRNESYGIFIDGEIIPHPDFVFIEKEPPVNTSVDYDELKSNEDYIPPSLTETKSGLLLFSNWEESRADKEAKAQRITTEIKNSTKGKSLSESTQRGIREKEMEAEKITASLNKKEYKEYSLAFYNPQLQKSYNKDLSKVKKVVALNVAVQTTLEVNGIEYYVVQSKYVAATA